MKLTPKCAESGFRHLSSKHENSHVVAVGLKVHAYTRSKHLAIYLHANNVSVDYFRILRLETQLADAVLRRMTLTQDVYIPPGLKKNKFLFFAIDSIDFAEDSTDGKDTLHGTMMTVYQQEDDLADPVVPPLELETPSSRSLNSSYSCAAPELLPCDTRETLKPTSSPKYKFTEKQQELIFGQYKKENQAWVTANTIQRNNSSLTCQAASRNISQHGQHTVP